MIFMLGGVWIREGECMSFARELTILRAKHKISLQKLADSIDVSKTHIWQLEKGVTQAPSLELVKKLADFFNVSIQSLVGENPESPNADPLSVAMYRKFDELDEIDKQAINEMVDAMIKRKHSRDNEIRSRKTQ